MNLRDVMKKYRIRQVDILGALGKNHLGQPVIRPSRMSLVVNGHEPPNPEQRKLIRKALIKNFDVPAEVVDQVSELIKK